MYNSSRCARMTTLPGGSSTRLKTLVTIVGGISEWYVHDMASKSAASHHFVLCDGVKTAHPPVLVRG